MRVDKQDLIELRVAPLPEPIATVRVVAADLSARADFDLDAVSDVRMAVDEACNQVALRAQPTASLRVVFHLDGEGSFHVVISAPSRIDPAIGKIDTDGFGWHVLRALTDELTTEHVEGPEGDEIVVRLVKRASGL